MGILNGMMISAILDARPPWGQTLSARGWGKGNADRIRAAMSSLLDRCRVHVDMVGFGPGEMATLDVNDSSEIAKQIAFEMNIIPSQELEEAIVDWIWESRETAGLAMKFGSSSEWERLAERRRLGPAMAPELRRLETTYASWSSPEASCLLEKMWARRFREELNASSAPVLIKLEGRLDLARAVEMIAGRTRSSTLKRYVVVYQRWRLWLREAKNH